MNPRTRRQQIEELDALLEGRLAPEDASSTSRRLASVATEVLERDPLPVVALDEDRKLALRHQLLDDIAALPAPAARRTHEVVAPRMRRAASQARVAVASTMAAAMVGTTGVAVAAQEALPGDALYGIKKATETLRLSLTGDHVSTGRLELRFAEERLEEVIAGSQDQRVADDDALIAALLEMDERSISGAEHLIRAAERDGRSDLLEEVAGFTDRQAGSLAGAYADLPAQVRPHAEDSLSVLRRIRMELLMPAIERCDCVEMAGTSSPHGGDDGDGVEAWFRSASLPLPPLGSIGSATLPDPDGVDPATETGDTTSSERRFSRAAEGTRSLIPALPGALNDIGSTVDQTVSKVVEDTTGTVGNVVEDANGTVGKVADGDLGGAVTDVVEDVGGTVGKVVEETADSVGKIVNGTKDTLDDLLGR